MRLDRLAALRRSTAGSAAVEAAIAAPLLVMLTVGTVETARFVFANMTMQGVAAGAAGELARDDRVDVLRVGDMLAGAGHLARPFDLDAQGQVVVSVVEGQSNGSPAVIWQARDARPGQSTSRIGVTGGPATLPGGLALAAGETVAVAEVFYALQPMFAGTAAFDGIYKTAVLRPRVGELRPPE